MELQVDEARGFAAGHDDHDAGERDQHAGDLPGAGALALEQPRAADHEHRRRRIEQHGIDRRRAAQALVHHRLEERHAEKREQRQDSRVAPQDLALAGHGAQAEGREHRERDEPAPEVQADGVERVAQRAAEHPVAGPQQIGEREERERGGARARGPQRAPAGRRGRKSAPAVRWPRA